MFSGPIQKESFIYKGPDIDVVLDKLPTAEAERLEDGTYRVVVEVYGNIGLDMWMRSQGDYVQRIYQDQEMKVQE